MVSEVSIETPKMSARPRIGFASRIPLSASPVAAKKAVKTPHMNTSPWAKLIMNSTP